MESVDLVEFVAVAFAVCGLVAIVWEIATSGPRDVIELVTDVRRFAEHPSPATFPADSEASAPHRKPAERQMVA
jgi:hypothetical protein